MQKKGSRISMTVGNTLDAGSGRTGRRRLLEIGGAGALGLLAAAVSPARSAPVTGADAAVYDVRTFGAVLDGVTDDGPAFQAALNSAAATGGTVLISGRMRLGSRVIADFHGAASSVVLQGTGSASQIIVG